MIPIGCSVKEEGFLYAQKVDGIFGLANKEDSIINQLYKEGKLIKEFLVSALVKMEVISLWEMCIVIITLTHLYISQLQ